MRFLFSLIAACLVAGFAACSQQADKRAAVPVQHTFFKTVTLGQDMRSAMQALYGQGLVDGSTHTASYNADTIPDDRGTPTIHTVLIPTNGQPIAFMGQQWQSVALTGTPQELYSLSFQAAECDSAQARQLCYSTLASLKAQHYPMQAMRIGTVQDAAGTQSAIMGHRYDNGTHLVQLHTSPTTAGQATVTLTYLVKEQ